MNLESLANTMREYANTVGDHHWQAAQAIELAIELQKRIADKPSIGQLTGRTRHSARVVKSGIFARDSVLVLQVEEYVGKYKPICHTDGLDYELVGIKTAWRDAKPEDIKE